MDQVQQRRHEDLSAHGVVDVVVVVVVFEAVAGANDESFRLLASCALSVRWRSRQWRSRMLQCLASHASIAASGLATSA